MSKTNFSKVEKSLEEGLIKMTSESLLHQTQKNPSLIDDLPPAGTRALVLQNIYRELKKIHKQNPAIYKTWGFHHQNLKKLIENPSLLTPQNWKLIKEVRERMESFKKDLAEQLPHLSNDDLIEQEREKHLNKRFNVNEKWVPLDLK